jgi:hypothetical protein
MSFVPDYSGGTAMDLHHLPFSADTAPPPADLFDFYVLLLITKQVYLVKCLWSPHRTVKTRQRFWRHRQRIEKPQQPGQH